MKRYARFGNAAKCARRGLFKIYLFFKVKQKRNGAIINYTTRNEKERERKREKKWVERKGGRGVKYDVCKDERERGDRNLRSRKFI